MIKVRQRIEFVDSAIGVMENYPKGKEKEIDGLVYVSTGELWEPQSTVMFASYPSMAFVLKSVQNFLLTPSFQVNSKTNSIRI